MKGNCIVKYGNHRTTDQLAKLWQARSHPFGKKLRQKRRIVVPGGYRPRVCNLLVKPPADALPGAPVRSLALHLLALVNRFEVPLFPRVERAPEVCIFIKDHRLDWSEIGKRLPQPAGDLLDSGLGGAVAAMGQVESKLHGLRECKRQRKGSQAPIPSAPRAKEALAIQRAAFFLPSMVSVLPVYRLLRIAGQRPAERWQGVLLTGDRNVDVKAGSWTQLIHHIVEREGVGATVGFVFGRSSVSIRALVETQGEGWWIGCPNEEENADVAPLDLFWRPELVPLAWCGALDFADPVEADLPLHESARQWLLAGYSDQPRTVHSLPLRPVRVGDCDAFGRVQNALLRQWLDQGDPQGCLPVIRQREAQWEQRENERLTQARAGLEEQLARTVNQPRFTSPQWLRVPSEEVCSETVDERFLQSRLAEAEAVTLDLFDTVLIRRVGRPVDVFWLLGQQLEAETGLAAEDFATVRARVEQEVRLAAHGRVEDIALAEIYERIAATVAADQARAVEWAAAEVALEERVLVAHPEFLRCKEWLTAKLRLCLSEMYLPAQTLERWVDSKAGLSGVDVWTSGETGLSKGSGRLYDRAAAHLQVTPARLLHIGDNLESDVEVPTRKGWKAHYWKARRSCRLDQPERWLPQSSMASCALGLLRAERRSDAPLPWQIGFELVGPIVWSWIHHLAAQPTLQESEEIWLLARDGFWLQRIWKKLPAAYQPGGALRYVAASRQLWGLAAIEDITADDWDFLLKAAPHLSTRDFFERAGMHVEELVKSDVLPWDRVLTDRVGFCPPELRDELYRHFVTNIEAFHTARRPRRERVLAYLQSLNPNGHRVTMVDLGWHGSSVGQLTRFARTLGWERPVAHYFASWQEAAEKVRSGARVGAFFADMGQPASRVALLRESVDLVECLFSAPHGSIVDLAIDEKGRFQRVESATDPRLPAQHAALEVVWEGAEAFCQAMAGLLPRPIAGHSVELAERSLERLLRFPQANEAALFADWQHVEGWGVARSRSIVDRVSEGASREELVRAGEESHWPRGWWALLSPGQREQILR